LPAFYAAATLYGKSKVTEETLKNSFKRFDSAGKGSIPCPEFKHALTTLGDVFTAQEVEEFLKEADTGGVINYNEYAKKLLAEATDTKKI